MKFIRDFSLIVILFLVSVSVYSQQKIKIEGNPTKENLDKWDSLITENIPSGEALNAVYLVAGKFHRLGFTMNSYYWLKQYEGKFPDSEKQYQQTMTHYEAISLTKYPAETNRNLYVKYILDKAPSQDAFIALNRIASEYINRKDWKKAKETYKKFEKYFPGMQELFYDMYEIFEREPEGLIVRNLGNKINTTNNEWDPNPTQDGEYLYFSAANRPGGKGGSDVWRSKLTDSGWAEPINLGNKVNADKNETIDNISTDGNTLLLSGNFMGTFGNFDIYSIDKDGDKWGRLYHYPFPINSEYVDEGGNITSDRKGILFTSDRPGGIGKHVEMQSIYHGNNMGNMDIYISFKTNTGWTDAINLGETVNTPYAERSPFLHPDGKTLYFSSDGHPGLGGLDVFVTERLDETWRNWSKPVNLGKEINTILNDWGYKIGITGDSATFSGFNRINGFGGWDIYSVKLPDNAKPNPVVTIIGNVKDQDGRPLKAELKWENLETGEILGTTESNPYSGHYFIVLPLGKNYGYFVDKPGYYPASNNINLKKADAGESIKEDVTLVSLNAMKNKKESVTINNIFFDYDSFQLKPTSYPELKRMAKFIKENNINSIKIIGHTDNTGTKAYNQNLSEKRALSVKDYLKEIIPNVEIKTVGKGTSEPLASNETETGRAKNRRVEVLIVD